MYLGWFQLLIITAMHCIFLLQMFICSPLGLYKSVQDHDNFEFGSTTCQICVYSTNVFRWSSKERFQPPTNGKPPRYLPMMLLLMANDINPNPGPKEEDSTIYNCGACHRVVTWDHRAVICDTCNQWFHIDCQAIHSETYSNLVADGSGVRWDCIKCENPNFSVICYGSTTQSAAVELSNQFSILASFDADSMISHQSQFMLPHQKENKNRDARTNSRHYVS